MNRVRKVDIGQVGTVLEYIYAQTVTMVVRNKKLGQDPQKPEVGWDNPKNPEKASDSRDFEQLKRQAKEAERRKEQLEESEKKEKDQPK